MPLRFRWKGATTWPVEGDTLTPSALSAAEASRQVIPVGNATAEVGDLFAIDEWPDAPEPLASRFEGDLRSVRGLGRGMAAGLMLIDGDVGAFCGERMSGGLIDVSGDAGAWLGGEMAGGRIVVRGDAGPYVGSARPGSRRGMTEGVILVHGRAGDESASRLRRGLIAVGGGVGEFFGRGMIAGSAFTFGTAGDFAGAGMKRGTVGLFGPGPARLLPTFADSGRFRFPFLTVYFRRLAGWGFPLPSRVLSAEMGRYNGDRAEGGRGEILVASA